MTVAVLAALQLSACTTSVEPQAIPSAEQPTAQTADYCDAFEAMLIAQPSGALGDEAMNVTMNFYADSVERLAQLSSPDDALLLFELAATARLVGDDPSDRVQAQRLGNLVGPVAAITVRASQVCGIAG